MAREIYEQYFRAAEAMPRGVVAKIRNIVQQLEAACAMQISQVRVRLFKPCCFHGAVEDSNSPTTKDSPMEELFLLLAVWFDCVVSSYHFLLVDCCSFRMLMVRWLGLRTWGWASRSWSSCWEMNTRCPHMNSSPVAWSKLYSTSSTM